MFSRHSHIHAVAVAFVRAVSGVDLVVEVKRQRRLERRNLTRHQLAQVVVIRWWEFIVAVICVMIFAIKLIIIHITLINVQFRHVDVDAEEAAQAAIRRKENNKIRFRFNQLLGD